MESDALHRVLYKAAQERLFNAVERAQVGEANVMDRMHRAGAESYVLKTCPPPTTLISSRDCPDTRLAR